MPIIEIIGPPGSGKTTFAKKVISFLEEFEVKTVYYDDMPFIYSSPFFRKVYNLLSKSRIAKKVFRKCFRSMQNKFIKFNLSRVNLHNNYKQLEKYYLENLPDSKYSESRIRFFKKSLAYNIFCTENCDKEFVIFDEGILQRIFSLSLSGAGDDIILSYLNIAPKPDITIIIDIEYETIKKQLIKRDGENSKFLEGLNNSIFVNRIGYRTLSKEGCTVFLVNSFDEDTFQDILFSIMNICIQLNNN